jgi:hypothetical protein
MSATSPVRTFGLTHVALATRACAAIQAADGAIKEQGEFLPGWYERPTPVDPPRRRTEARRA